MFSSRLGRTVSAEVEPGGVGRATPSVDSAQVGTWESLGPGNIGGRTRVLVIDPGKPQTMYAGGVSGGVWRTRNGGKRWEPVGEELGNIAINSMAMDPRDPSTILVGTGEGYFREVVRGTGLPLRGRGIWATHDRGDTWSMLEATDTANFNFVNDIVFSPHDSDRIYAGTREGVFRSVDGGASWKRILNPRVNGGCLDLEIRTDVDGDTLFASCGTFARATVWRSEDAESGADFVVSLSERGMARTEIALAPSDQSVIYALSASNVPGPGGNYEQALYAVFASESGGDPGSWEARTRNTSATKLNTVLLHHVQAAMGADCFGEESVYINMGWYANVLAVDPVDPDRVFAGSVYLFRSDDGGREWGTLTLRVRHPTHVDQHGLVFDPRYNGRNNRTLYLLNDGGIYRTKNALAHAARFPEVCQLHIRGPRFVGLNHNYGVTQFYHGVPYADGTRYLGGAQDNGTVRGSDSRGANDWERLSGGDGTYSAVDAADPDTVYVQTQWAQLRKSTDGGETFVDATNGLEQAVADYLGTDTNYLFATPLLMDPTDSQRLWLGGRRVWRTDDGAGLWGAASRTLAHGDKVSAISVAPSDPERVLVGTDNGRIYRQDHASGAGPATRWPARRPRRGWVTWVAHDPNDERVAYATYGSYGGKHVFRTTDGGRSWRSIDGGGAAALPDIPVHSVVVSPSDGDRIYLGTDLGVFVTNDGGESWATENTGFGAIVTETLALLEVPAGKTYLFAFTHGRGAWRVGLAGE